MILFDSRWSGPHGIGRFSSEIGKQIPGLVPVPHTIPLLHPLEPLLLTGMAIKAKREARAYFSPGFNPPLWAPMPVIFTIHDLIHLRFEHESCVAKKLYYNTVVRPGVKRAAKVLTVSEFSKQEILEWTGVDADHVHVVGNGVGPEFSPTGTRYEPGYPYLLYIGNRKPHKNIPRMLEGFARSGLPDDIRLLVSGDPDSATVVQCQLLGLKSKVIYLGRISNADLPKYYRGALGLLMPSLYEGFGLPALEAMASGTPVLASNITSLPEVVGDCAVMVDPWDVSSISHGIVSLCEESGPARSMRIEKGMRQALKFDWSRTAGLVQQELDKLIRHG